MSTTLTDYEVEQAISPSYHGGHVPTAQTRYSFVARFSSYPAARDRAFAIILSPEDFEDAVKVDTPTGRAYWRATQYATSCAVPQGMSVKSVTLKEIDDN